MDRGLLPDIHLAAVLPEKLAAFEDPKEEIRIPVADRQNGKEICAKVCELYDLPEGSEGAPSGKRSHRRRMDEQISSKHRGQHKQVLC